MRTQQVANELEVVLRRHGVLGDVIYSYMGHKTVIGPGSTSTSVQCVCLSNVYPSYQMITHNNYAVYFTQIKSTSRHYRGFASSVVPWQLHGDGGHIGGQLSIGLIQFTLQYGCCHHVFFAEKVNKAKPLLCTLWVQAI